MTTTPEIWVGCLAAYNNGHLHGRWIDASTDTEAMQEEINDMLAESPEPGAEEWAIMDSEGLGDLGEYAGLGEVARRCRLAEVAEDWGIKPETLIEAMDMLSSDPEADPEEIMQDHYRGFHESWAVMAEELAEECGDIETIPENFRLYIDWEAMGRDMEINGDFIAIEEEGHLAFFWAH